MIKITTKKNKKEVDGLEKLIKQAKSAQAPASTPSTPVAENDQEIKPVEQGPSETPTPPEPIEASKPKTPTPIKKILPATTAKKKTYQIDINEKELSVYILNCYTNIYQFFKALRETTTQKERDSISYIYEIKDSIDFSDTTTLGETVLDDSKKMTSWPNPWLEKILKNKPKNEIINIKSIEEADEKDKYVRTNEGYEYYKGATWFDVKGDIQTCIYQDDDKYGKVKFIVKINSIDDLIRAYDVICIAERGLRGLKE